MIRLHELNSSKIKIPSSDRHVYKNMVKLRQKSV